MISEPAMTSKEATEMLEKLTQKYDEEERWFEYLDYSCPVEGQQF